MQEFDRIDIKQLFSVLWRKAYLIILVTILFGAAAFTYTYYFITPLYTSSITLYVNNYTDGDTITNSDLSVSRSLVDTCVTIIQSTKVLEKVADEAEADISASELFGIMDAGAVSGTEIFKVTIENEDPELAAKIANAVAQVAPDAIEEIVSASSVKIIDYASVSTKSTYPNFKLNTAVGAALGFIFIVMIIVLIQFFDVRIKSEEDLERIFDIPVLGVIPAFEKLPKNNSGYGYKEKY